MHSPHRHTFFVVVIILTLLAIGSVAYLWIKDSSYSNFGATVLNAPLNFPTSINSKTAPSSCTTLTQYLKQGSSDADTRGEVTLLQQYLIGQGYLSSNAPLGYFGPLTRRAVLAFQLGHNVLSTGSVGPLTRGVIGAAVNCTQNTNHAGMKQVISYSCTNLAKHLEVGSQDAAPSGEVTMLQQYLIKQGYLKAATTSGYFGSLTQSAVVSFQNAVNIAPTGTVGPVTRKTIGAINCVQVITYVPIGTIVPPLTGATPPPNRSVDYPVIPPVTPPVIPPVVPPVRTAPSVSAGVDQNITLPTNTTSLTGSVVETGTITGYTWTQVSGPSNALLAGATTTTLTASNLIVGTYTFSLRATNDANLSGSGSVTVTVTAAQVTNRPPTVTVSADQSITLPISIVNVTGIATDSDGAIASYQWTVSGPNTPTMVGANTPTLVASNLVAGTYIFTLKVRDNLGALASAISTITVNPAVVINTPPTVSAGNNQTITLPTSNVFLVGSATDNGTISLYTWVQASGPSTATLSGASTATLAASNLIQGTYTFRLTATDNGGLTASANVTVTVNAASVTNTPPVVSAGPNINITLPTNAATLNGSATDNVGISSYLWTQVSGPNSATRNGAITPTLVASNLIQGVYVFRLTAFDNVSLSASSTATVTVNPATVGNVPPTVSVGQSQTITLPTNSVSLTGSATDSDGTIASYQWTASGPSTPTLSGANTSTLTASNLIAGTYTFTLKAFDNLGASGSASVTVTVQSQPNQNNISADEQNLLDASVTYYNFNNTVIATSTGAKSFKITAPDGTVLRQNFASDYFVGDFEAVNGVSPLSITKQFVTKYGGVDVVVTVKNTTANPLRVPNLLISGIKQPTTGTVDVLFPRAPTKFFTVTPGNTSTYVSGGWVFENFYPQGEFVSPVILTKGPQYAIGASLQFDSLGQKEERRVALRYNNITTDTRYGTWDYLFDDPAPGSCLTVQCQINTRKTIPAGATYTYTMSIRASTPANWVYTQYPYKHFLSTQYGIDNTPSQIQNRDRSPVRGMTLSSPRFERGATGAVPAGCAPSCSTDTNPRGYGIDGRGPTDAKYRLDKSGWGPFVTDFLSIEHTKRGYNRSMLWGATGEYDVLGSRSTLGALNYPAHFMNQWVPAAQSSLSELLKFKQSGMALGLWWGNSSLIPIPDQWDPTKYTPFNSSIPSHVSFVTNQVNLAKQAGVGIIGFDSFVNTTAFERYTIAQIVKNIDPSIKMVAEASQPDFVQKNVGVWTIGRSDATGAHIIFGPDYLENYLLPGIETWIDIGPDYSYARQLMQWGYTPMIMYGLDSAPTVSGLNNSTVPLSF